MSKPVTRWQVITPDPAGHAAFYESLGRVDLTENHSDEKPVSVSGTAMFSRALSDGMRLNAWNTNPICSRR